MKITFSRLQPHHGGIYRSLRLAALKEFPDHFGAIYEEQVQLPKLWMEGNIESSNPDTFVMGAWDGEDLIGICAMHHDTAPRRRHIATVMQMYVRPQYSGNRIGLGMLTIAMEEAWNWTEVEMLYLEVFSCSKAATRIYEQAGFEATGVSPHYLKTEAGYLDVTLMLKWRP